MRPFQLILLLSALMAVLVAAAPIEISAKIDALAKAKGESGKYRTAKDMAIFWSLDPPTKYKELGMNKYLEDTYKQKNGGKRLLIDLINDDGGPPEGLENERGYWAAISREFAAGASGETVYLIGAPRLNFDYKDTIFYQTELPTLTRAGTKVTSIVAIDAINQENKRVIWKTGDGHWGMGGKDEAKTPADIFTAPTSACGDIVKRAGGASCAYRPGNNKAKPAKGGATSGQGGTGARQSGQRGAASKSTKAKPAKGGATSGQAGTGARLSGQRGAASKGTKATPTTKKAGARGTQPKAAARQARPATAAGRKPRVKRAGPSRISWDI